MKRLFQRDSITTGLVAGLGSEVMTALLLTTVLLLTNLGIEGHQRWYAACFIPPLLLLRHYAKERNHPTVTKTLATLLFVTFVAFMFYLLKAHLLTLK